MTPRPLPEGVVTFLFTDIEGSTALLQSSGEEYPAILEEHNRLVRAAVAEHEGHEVATTGDGFFVAFRLPVQAVAAAAEAQRRLGGSKLLAAHTLKVRMGVHSGEAQVAGQNYVGLAVHHASRVAGAGHGGQVVVSEATRLMVGEEPAIGFRDLGEHLLKDVGRPLRLFQVTGPGLAASFPTLRSLNGGLAELPVTRTSFVGREEDLRLLLAHLSEPGLVTLTGPGGTGKTRLAIEAAKQISGSLEGTWFVDLQAVVDPDDVPTVVAAALQVSDPGQREGPLERMVERVHRQPCLIVMDNCEHLVDACAGLVTHLLHRCPELRVLATSRDLLGVTIERPQRVPPLDAAGAAQLFVDRARRILPDFDPGSHESALTKICKRLDGIPLAIELAAARVRHMPLSELEARLSDIFLLLVGTRGRGLQRHQTLETVVDWSHDLLTAPERAVLRRISVLAGGFTLEAAEEIAAGDPVVGPVSDLVFRLVDASLVEHDGRGRYRQLETLRAYGSIKLRDAGETESVRGRHVAFFTSAAEAAAEGLRHGDFFDSLDAIEVESRNFFAALEWAAGSDPGAALRLVAATAQFAALTRRGSFLELCSRVAEETEGPVELRAGAHLGMALAASVVGWDRYATHAETALELLERAGAPAGDEERAWVLASLALAGAASVEAVDIAQTVRRAKELAIRCELPEVEAAAEAAEGWLLVRAGDVPSGRAALRRATDAKAEIRPSVWSATALFWSGIAELRAEEWAAAISQLRRALPMFQRVSYKLYVQWTLDGLSFAELYNGNLAAARAYAEEGVALSLESGLGAGTNLFYLYERLGFLEAVKGDPAQAVQYYERALALVEPDSQPHDYAALQSNLASARAQVGDVERAGREILSAIDLTASLRSETQRTGVATPPVANAVQATARWCLAVGRLRDAAVLAGAVTAIRPLATAPEPVRQYSERFHAAIRAALADEEVSDLAFKQGAELDQPLERARQILVGDSRAT